MVSARNMTARTKARRSAIVVALPHEVVIDIVGHVAVCFPQPMADLCSLRATCKAMYKASKVCAVERRMALEQEEAMKWLDNVRYLAVVNHLADAGNPETCFIVGVTLVFAHQDMQCGLVCLNRDAVTSHKATAYVLGLLLYTAGEASNVGKHYISQVEGELAGGGCEIAKRTNGECRRCQRLTTDVVSNVTWKMVGPQGRVLVVPEVDHCYTSTGCDVNVGRDDYIIFYSNDCRIRHEYAKFLTGVIELLVIKLAVLA